MTISTQMLEKLFYFSETIADVQLNGNKPINETIT